MVHGYHIILPCYGFWLPNDPRGSWSDYVARWELARFGKSTKLLEQRTLSHLSPQELAMREAALAELLYPPVVLTGEQALSVGRGFGILSAKSGYSIWACAVLPYHTHLVVARHYYKAEQMANLLKGAATRQLREDQNHPLAEFVNPEGKVPGMWSENQWIVYLNSEVEIENAMAYVIENPAKEGKPIQDWSFITPFSGLDGGWVTYH
jgi:REP element-mobilizing transposase RayT